MNDPPKKVHQLLRLAGITDFDGEAAAAAVNAARMYVKYDLDLTSSSDASAIALLQMQNRQLINENRRLLNLLAIQTSTGAKTKTRRIVSKYNATCVNCGEPISAGDRINWKKGAGSSHVECGEP